MPLSESGRRARFYLAIKAEGELQKMKNVSAFQYMQNLEMKALSPENARIAQKFFARMEAIDAKLLALKSERRTMADWFLKVAAEQRGAK
jgi:hypothetical protein